MSGDHDSDDDNAVAASRIPYASYAPAGGGWGWGWGWPPVYRDGGDESRVEGTSDAVDGSLWDEGLVSLFLVCGVVLFLFPEPTTSFVGIGLIIVGLVAWLVDALV